MKAIRIGNDIVVRWTISRNGAPATLNADNISLLISARGQQYRITDFFIEGNTIVFTFLGKDQKCCGAYNLICIENEGVEGMHTTDMTDAFILVDSSSKAGRGCCPEQVQLETVDLESELFAPADGLSAYEVAVRHGFIGTEEEWLESLKQRGYGADIENGSAGYLEVTHNLDRYPKVCVTALDDEGERTEILVGVKYVDKNQLIVYWNGTLEEGHIYCI